MKFRIFTVDAFARSSFEGNPAAIIPLDKDVKESDLQKIASEINLSETAFLTIPKGGYCPDGEEKWKEGSRFGLRWFTPTNEVNLCGHATLASAHALFECIGNKSPTLEFETLSGILLAKRSSEFSMFPNAIVLDFPQNPPQKLTKTQNEEFSKIVEEVSCGGQVKVREVLLSPSAGKLLVRLENSTTRSAFESLQPSMQRLVEFHDGSIFKGIILTIVGNAEELNLDESLRSYDFVSRYFAPWNGIPEDPVTGAAHTVLAPYWSEELSSATMTCRQCSPRGGDLTVRLTEGGRVEIVGTAKTVIEGQINI